MVKTLGLSVAVVLGVATEANGLFMLALPVGRYFAVPGVTTTEPFNQHLVHDISAIAALAGSSAREGEMDPLFEFSDACREEIQLKRA